MPFPFESVDQGSDRADFVLSEVSRFTDWFTEDVFTID